MNPPDAIRDRLDRLEEYVLLLEGLRGRDLQDPYVKGALERFLHLAAECALDVGEMVIATRRLPKAESYREVIERLAEAGILEEAFAARFRDVAGLRNILVHDYTRIDLGRLQAFLSDLDDFRTFATQVAASL